METIIVNSIKLIPITDSDGAAIIYQGLTGSLKECKEQAEKMTWLDFQRVAFYHAERRVMYVPVAKEWR